MRSSLSWSVVLLFLFSHVSVILAASGEAHAAERILWYMNYLAEEEYVVASGGTRQYKIAPTCSGSRTGGRCTLPEFLLHIWSGSATQAPTAANKPTGFTMNTYNPILNSPEDHSVLDLVNALTALKTNKLAKKSKLPTSAIGIIWAEALWPDTPQPGYFDIMGRMGQAINQLKTSLGTNAPSDRQNKILSLGKDAGRAVVDLRFEDMETYRLTALTTTLGYKPSTQKVTVEGMGRDFDMLDIVQNEKDHAGSTAAVEAANKNYETTDPQAPKHLDAIQNAMDAELEIHCSL